MPGQTIDQTDEQFSVEMFEIGVMAGFILWAIKNTDDTATLLNFKNSKRNGMG